MAAFDHVTVPGCFLLGLLYVADSVGDRVQNARRAVRHTLVDMYGPCLPLISHPGPITCVTKQESERSPVLVACRACLPALHAIENRRFMGHRLSKSRGRLDSAMVSAAPDAVAMNHGRPVWDLGPWVDGVTGCVVTSGLPAVVSSFLRFLRRFWSLRNNGLNHVRFKQIGNSRFIEARELTVMLEYPKVSGI
ncbi:hypothetical protein B0H65DRAFT_443644 [Neurospora tetraspora]|uniref:Uncharacterized protein n=1 Tax=Neurospora tetraspora TaxID=94610 RepID=A0AAE0JCW4_9PEZI|nr:hypothetical protein B0H65DRAFT_443644 [Neurospora tetraspora]